MTGLNETHDAALRSWVESANAAEHRLPDPEPAVRRVPPQGHERGVPRRRRDRRARSSISRPRTRPAHSPAKRRARRRTAPGPRSTRSWRWDRRRGRRCGSRSRARCAQGSPLAEKLRGALVQQAHAEHVVPAWIGDYTDFYASVHHATTVGKMFRPDNPLLPNYKWVPIGYHGRASSIGVSGQTFPRPLGQTMPPGAAEPAFGPSKRLDYELEVGIYVGVGNALGRADRDRRRRVARLRAVPPQRLVGARHPGLGVPAARAVPREELRDDGLAVDRDARGARAVSRRVDAGGRRPAAAPLSRFAGRARARRDRRRARGVARDGADARRRRSAGAPVAHELPSTPTGRSGRWSPTTRSTAATCSRAISSAPARNPARRRRRRGRCSSFRPAGRSRSKLPNGETRAFLEDGDAVILRAAAERPGFRRIGFGECRGTVLAAA